MTRVDGAFGMGRSSAITQAILDMAARQYGVVSRQQLLARSIAPRTIDKRISRASLFVIYPGVYAAGSPLLTSDGILMASLLGAGEGAVIGGRSAAAVWRFRKHQSPIDVLRLNGGTSQRARLRVSNQNWWPYLLIHKPRELPERDVTFHHGLKLTTPARTLRDLAAELPQKQFFHAFTEADRLGLLKDRELMDCAERTQGRRGGAMFRQAVSRRIPGVKEAASLLEAIVLELCREKRIPAPESNKVTAGYRPDFRWPEHRVIVEVDGYEFHRGQEMFENDLLRAERLRDEGWEVLRFSWRMMIEHPDRVARSILKALSKK